MCPQLINNIKLPWMFPLDTFYFSQKARNTIKAIFHGIWICIAFSENGMSTYLLNPGAQYRKHEGHPQCLSWSDDPPREALAWLDRYMGKLRERAFPRQKNVLLESSWKELGKKYCLEGCLKLLLQMFVGFLLDLSCQGRKNDFLEGELILGCV